MPPRPQTTPSDKPTDIALEAFRLLARRREAPTPDAYRLAYEEIARTVSRPAGEVSLVAHLAATAAQAANAAAAAREAPRAGTPSVVQAAVQSEVQPEVRPEARPAVQQTVGETAADRPAAAASDGASVPPDAEAGGISTPVPQSRMEISLVETQRDGSAERQNVLLRDLLARTLGLSVAPLLQDAVELAAEARSLGEVIKAAGDEEALDQAAARLRQLCFRIDMRSSDMAEQQDLLLKLFRLLLDNVSQLVDDDSWMQGQLAATDALLAGPITYRALDEASRSLKEVVYKQGVLKKGMAETKSTVKKMMLTFIDQIASLAATTSDFQQKIDGYSSEVSQASDIEVLNEVLEKIMQEARATQIEAMRSHDYMLEAKRDVTEAENRIQGLQTQLAEMSELVREDHLTGILNRRGLDDMLEQEIERAERRRTPLCIAMLDLDDFKRLNDTHGHQVGDEVLVHLVQVIRETLRALDIIGRFGGEEFVIVLPNTSLEEACATATRLQRELTGRIFMHKEARLFITFSAGVVLRKAGEEAKSVIARADKALYSAKKSGKNRIVSDLDMEAGAAGPG